jgi:hypothetical protein
MSIDNLIVQEFVTSLGFVHGRITREEVRSWFRQHGCTEADFERIHEAFKPFYEAVHRAGNGAPPPGEEWELRSAASKAQDPTRYGRGWTF